MQNIYLTVICPVYNEEKFIGRCIESLLDQTYSYELMELYFIDGMSTDSTRNIIAEYQNKYAHIKMLSNPHKTVPYALNLGIKHSVGEIIIRIDAHCEYPKNYLAELVHQLKELKADNVGGVWETLPSGKSELAKAIALCSSHYFGVGTSLHKIGVTDIVETDTVPYGCFNSDIFKKIGYFDTEMVRNQDDEFNGRIINYGGKIYILPHLVIKYYARSNLMAMCKMYFQYGLYKPLVNMKLGRPTSMRQFAPPIFTLYIIFILVFSIFLPKTMTIYIVGVSVYILFALYFSAIQAIKSKDIYLLFIMPLVFLAIHLSYGVGYLAGMLKNFRLFIKKVLIKIISERKRN